MTIIAPRIGYKVEVGEQRATVNRRRDCGKGNVKSAMRKKTADDEDGRK